MSTKLGSKAGVYVAVTMLLVAAVAYGVASLTGLLEGFRADVLLAPVKMMVQFWPLTMMVLVAAIALVVAGVQKATLWYLAPAGILLTGLYWLAANVMVVKLLESLR